MSANPAKKNRNYVYGFSIVAFLMFLSSVILALYNNDVFKTKTHFSFKVFAANGLKKRPPVYYKGIEIGRVSEFSLKKTGMIFVDFFVMNNFKDFLSDKYFLYLNRNPLTGAIVDVSLIDGGNGDPVNENHEFLTNESDQLNKESLKKIHAGEKNAVNNLVTSVERLLETVEKNELINNLSLTVGRLEKISKYLDELTNDQKNNDVVVGAAKKDYGEVKKMIGLLNEDLYLLKGILGEVYKKKETIAPTIERGGRTLLKSEKILDGLENNSIIRRVISSEPNDIEKGSF